MGAYLTAPNLNKESCDSENEFISYGASSMQGWRVSQEDAHNAIIDYDEVNKKTSFFAVYDGHGGSDVAAYCSKHLPEMLKTIDEYKSGCLEDALKQGFLKFDQSLTNQDAEKELALLAGTNSDTNSEMDGDEDDGGEGEEEEEADDDGGGEEAKSKDKEKEEVVAGDSTGTVKAGSESEVETLYDEATMPIDEVLKRYSKTKKAVKNALKKRFGELAAAAAASSMNDDEDEEEEEGKKEKEKKSAGGGSGSSSKSEEELVNGETGGDGEGKSSNGQVAGVNGGETKKVAKTKKVDLVAEFTSKCLKENSILIKDGDDDEDDDDDDDDDDDEEDDEDYEEDGGDDDDEEEEGDDDDDEEGDEDEDEDEDYEEDEVDDDTSNLQTFLGDGGKPGYDSGCTAVVALLHDKELYVANAGDSRCVVCRNGKAIDMSVDHKPEDDDERKRIEKAGGKVTSDGRVNGGLNLSRAIGDHSYKLNKELPLESQMISSLPDIRKLELNDEDEFMVLACDGIWNSMTSQEVVDFVHERLNVYPKLSLICEDLFIHCLAPNCNGDGTGCDNMTCIIVTFKPYKPKTTSTNPQELTNVDQTTTTTVNGSSNESTTKLNGSLKRALSDSDDNDNDNENNLNAFKKLKNTKDESTTIEKSADNSTKEEVNT